MNNTFKCNSASTQHWLQIDISIFFFSNTNLWPSQVLEGGQVSGTRQNPPTFDRNPWRRPTPESCKSKIEIMTTKKRLRFVRDSLTELSLCWREPDLWCWCQCSWCKTKASTLAFSYIAPRPTSVIFVWLLRKEGLSQPLSQGITYVKKNPTSSRRLCVLHRL